MTARLATEAIVAFHFAFIAFVVAGGLLVLVHRGWALLHLPAVAWAAWTEFTGMVCPLTPIENSLRRRAGDAGYSGGFIDHYLVPLIYPDALTSRTQMVLGVILVVGNAILYAMALRRWRKRKPA